MLDELMGKNRNAAPDDKSQDVHWSDKDVCSNTIFLYLYSILNISFSIRYADTIFAVFARQNSSPTQGQIWGLAKRSTMKL